MKWEYSHEAQRVILGEYAGVKALGLRRGLGETLGSLLGLRPWA